MFHSAFIAARIFYPVICWLSFSSGCPVHWLNRPVNQVNTVGCYVQEQTFLMGLMSHAVLQELPDSFLEIK